MQIKELGHVVLYVSSLKRSQEFYRDVLGFREVAALGGMGAVFSSGRTHHELLLLEVGGKPEEKSKLHQGPGLYHIGLKIGDSLGELKKAYRELQKKKVQIIGATDHGVTLSLYVLDPDGNEIELYADVSDAWKTDPSAIIAQPKHLDLEDA